MYKTFLQVLRIQIIEEKGIDNARFAVSEIVYLDQWGNKASYDELESSCRHIFLCKCYSYKISSHVVSY